MKMKKIICFDIDGVIAIQTEISTHHPNQLKKILK